MSNGEVKILGTGSSVPERIITNFDLEKMVDTSDEWITTRTGIKERRIAQEEESTSTFALLAAQRALQAAQVSPEELDLIIVATVTPDMLFPATACLLQRELKAHKAASFDLEAGCTGFVYALSLAEKYLRGGGGEKALVVGAETLSKILDWEDRSTCVLFGDGAGAAVLGLSEEEGIIATYLGSDGGGAHLLELPAGCSRMPASLDTVNSRLHYIKMNGNEVFKFAVKIMEEASLEVIKRGQVEIDEVSLFIPHQANIRIINSAAKRLGIPEEKVFVNVHKYGNTSSASVPLALDEAYREGKIKRSDLVLLVGFGAGLTWGSALIRW
ncbi:MAG TPA: beta-ketoacyl-ACP synthase III [Candidatus Atribacteria bacterium]|uniref:beta-ketoacyl-ACP synthase III n=1 Tax=Candidatus Sordicultor fermentans TaxID=1953203 RepID=UPI0016A045AF|nr:ketoacyl-ACP synthase III [Atribacterota bacterium]NLY06467.1 ketoacyl-ACP synthase III [Candidatus Atribacteria bacterium]MDI9606872.1 beta-ketoacyl-ACP synthase III [Atribacterota bacterium]MDY0134736.1 beta-ketoacyl-ACP synthase III [Atribacterota bacterium]HOA99493.1 beta-ketoacyl-ACP synthase III [Candidatus Atribacteria bacterium]